MNEIVCSKADPPGVPGHAARPVCSADAALALPVTMVALLAGVPAGGLGVPAGEPGRGAPAGRKMASLARTSSSLTSRRMPTTRRMAVVACQERWRRCRAAVIAITPS